MDARGNGCAPVARDKLAGRSPLVLLPGLPLITSIGLAGKVGRSLEPISVGNRLLRCLGSENEFLAKINLQDLKALNLC